MLQCNFTPTSAGCCAGKAGDNSSPRPDDKQVGQRGFLFKYTNVNYDLFVEKMKDKRASGLRAELQRFCKNFMEMNKPPREVAREMVQNFIAEFEERMAVVSLEREEEDGLTMDIFPAVF